MCCRAYCCYLPLYTTGCEVLGSNPITNFHLYNVCNEFPCSVYHSCDVTLTSTVVTYLCIVPVARFWVQIPLPTFTFIMFVMSFHAQYHSCDVTLMSTVVEPIVVTSVLYRLWGSGFKSHYQLSPLFLYNKFLYLVRQVCSYLNKPCCPAYWYYLPLYTTGCEVLGSNPITSVHLYNVYNEFSCSVSQLWCYLNELCCRPYCCYLPLYTTGCEVLGSNPITNFHLYFYIISFCI